MGDEEVKVYGFGFSPSSVRVEIALKIKGVEYEFVEEDLKNKSEDLVKYNPVHKKVPVLVHNGKPIAESLVILEYIHETWKGNPLLPDDPYERAQARFWAKFFDDKLVPVGRNAMMRQGREGGDKAVEEAHELLKFVEDHIKNKKLLMAMGGNYEIDYFDLVGLLVAYWMPIHQEAAGKELLTRDKYPAIYTWADTLLGCNVIKENLQVLN